MHRPEPGTLVRTWGNGGRERVRFWWRYETASSAFSLVQNDGRLNPNTPAIIVCYDAGHDITQILTYMGTVWVYHCDLRNLR
jgi:hypothetical protein